MAIELTKSAESNDNRGSFIWERSVDVASGETSEWLILPDGAGAVQTWLAFLIPDSSARIEATVSSRAKVIAGTAEAYAWSAGNVAVNTGGTFENVSALRVVSVTGSATLEVRVS